MYLISLFCRVSLVNSAIVAYFMDDLHINKHFDLFKKLLFMEDGEFSLSLSNQLFEKVPVNRTVHFKNYILRVSFPLENLKDLFHRKWPKIFQLLVRNKRVNG